MQMNSEGRPPMSANESTKPTAGPTLPLQIEADAPHIIIDSSHNPVQIAKCAPTITGEAHARLIVRAVNAHEALVKELKYLRSQARFAVSDEAIARADAAIKMAEEQS